MELEPPLAGRAPGVTSLLPSSLGLGQKKQCPQMATGWSSKTRLPNLGGLNAGN
jgi:hypothetical protein